MEKYYIRKKIIKERLPRLRWNRVKELANIINCHNNVEIHQIKTMLLTIPKDSLRHLLVDMFNQKDFVNALLICYPYREFLKTLPTSSPQPWDTMALGDLISGMMQTLAENQDVIKHKHNKEWQTNLIKRLKLYDVDTLYNAHFYSDQTKNWTLEDYLKEAIRGDLV